MTGPGWWTRLWMHLVPSSVYDVATENAARRRQTELVNQAQETRRQLADASRHDADLAAAYRREDAAVRRHRRKP